ncbi:MAG TPA: hypothetical protein ACFCUD_10070 [Cyclobacteriaceae bacterium]
MSSSGSNNRSALEESINYLSTLTNSFNETTRFRLITNDNFFVKNRYLSKAEIMDRLTEIEYSTFNPSFQEISNKIKSYSSNPEGDIFYVLSDFQRTTFGDFNDFNDSINYYNLINISSKESNVFIDSVYLENPMFIEGENNQLTVKIRNVGDKSYKDLSVKLLLNSDQISSINTSINSNSIKNIEFDINNISGDFVRGTIVIDDFPVSFDNEFYFVLDNTEKVKILEIKEIDSKTQISKAFGNKSLFNLTSNKIRNINYNLFNDTEILVLNELESIPNGLMSQINNFLSEGKDLLIVPGENIDLKTYSNLLGRKLNNVKLGEQLPLSPDGFINPFFQNIFEEQSNKVEMPFAKPILQVNGYVDDILKLKNGFIFLGNAQNNGNVFFFTSPLKDQYTNFHKHGIFIPTLYKIAFGTKSNKSKIYYHQNQRLFNIKSKRPLYNEIVELKPANTEDTFIPNQRVTNKDLILELPPTIANPGFYQIINNGNVYSELALNYSKAELDLIQYNNDELRKAFIDFDNVIINDSTDYALEAEISNLQWRDELWRIAIVLALVFLLLEVLFIRFL